MSNIEINDIIKKTIQEVFDSKNINDQFKKQFLSYVSNLMNNNIAGNDLKNLIEAIDADEGEED